MEHGGTKERFVLTDGNWSTIYWTGTGKDRNDRFHETGMKIEDIPERGEQQDEGRKGDRNLLWK